ncbi:hypothetical protein ACFWUQ_24860 [Streptomyces sp. NPDC058662]|uniref:hypothetical protein n=1 Tax=Streptomyces sp. NPDC058662 TaxID=3346583 RepID=UPI00365656E1
MQPVRTLSAAGLALALGLSFAAPATAAGGAAAPKVTAPATSPTPGFAGEGTGSDCYTDPYAGSGAGWIGTSDVTLRATTNTAPGGTELLTTFQLWDTSYGGKRTDHPSSWSTWPQAGTTVPRDRLADGGLYAWRARATDGKLTSAYTAWCYFRVDHAPPTAEVTTDATPKRVGEEATFTLKGADRGSEIACARWQTSGTFSVGWRCSDETTDSRVVRLTDGAVDIKVKPETWGSQYVYLQAMDNAGNVSQPTGLNYYAQPSTAPAAFGDIDADGKPDALTPDAAGNLRIAGSDPRTAPNARAASAPGGSESFPTLWARSRADGTVRAYSLTGSPDAPDFSAFADPAAGPVLTTLTPAAHPRVGSDGDLTGDGLPDLWSADASGKAAVFPGLGTTAPHPTVTGFAPAV